MSTMAIHRPDLIIRPSCHGTRNHQNFQKKMSMTMNSKFSQQRKKKEEFKTELPKNFVSQSATSNLQFDRLQQLDQAFIQEEKVEFGQFVAREAILDEEYWTAAWLRAQCHWEDHRRDERYVQNYIRKFTDQEFNAIKRRCKAQLEPKCFCLVTVKEEKDVIHTVLKSVVGTLDLSIRNLLHGESFPGERVKTPRFCSIGRKGNRYGYIANLCVAKSARRQGIASNMLHFAIRSANQMVQNKCSCMCIEITDLLRSCTETWALRWSKWQSPSWQQSKLTCFA